MDQMSVQSFRETLEFMQEVRDYIARFPDIPINREMLTKIDGHLANPTRKSIQNTPATRTGGSYTPAGVSLVEAVLRGDELTISIPKSGSAVRDAKILSSMRKGLTFVLKPA